MAIKFRPPVIAQPVQRPADKPKRSLADARRKAEKASSAPPPLPTGPETYHPNIAKKAISIRLDEDVLEALKARGPGWQTFINSVLRQRLSL